MSLNKKTCLSLLFLVISAISGAQQVPTFSQYIMNGYLVNPSLAGRDGFTSINVTAREQWIGMRGGPSTYAASFQTNLGKSSGYSRRGKGRSRLSRPTKPSRVGIGSSIFNDNNGIIRRTGIKFDYAYHIPLSDSREGQDDLSMGLGMVTYQYMVKTDGLQYSYSDDPYFSTLDKTAFITDFSFGTAYTTNNFYIGFSMTNILRGSLIYFNDSENNRGEKGHYFLTGGTNIKINRDWAIKPSAFIKASDFVMKSIQMDVTARAFYKDNYWAGLSYRTNDAFILLFGLRYDKFYIGNAIDFTTTAIRKNSFGSYEISLAAKFGDSNRKYRWLNAF